VTTWDSSLPPSLNSEEDVAFLLDADLRFLECSPAWDLFATANGGRRISRKQILGTCILDFTPDILRKFYQYKYSLARTEDGTIEFDYHCSSPDKIRLFRMFISVFEDNILIVNHLKLEEACDVRPPVTAEERQLYIYAGNFVTMCANCRKVRRADVKDTWVWVPEFLVESELQVSHGLCPRCLELIYGNERSDQT